MTDLNSASSAQIGVTFFEAHAINKKGQILAMGRMTEGAGMSGETAHSKDPVCAPAPPSSFLLTPVDRK